MFSKKIVSLTLLVCFLLMFMGTSILVSATTISVSDSSVADWAGVTRFNDGQGDATGSGDTDLVKLWVTSDATNLYCRWDVILASNKNKIASAGYSVALTSVVPSPGTQPTAELLAFVGFKSDGTIDSVALMKSGDIVATYSTANAKAVGSGYGATVSVEAKFSFAAMNTFIGSNKFGPSADNVAFPLWGSAHTSPSSVKFSTRSVSDICPNAGYLNFNTVTGVVTPVGTGPVASIIAAVSNPNALPGGTINYTVKITNAGDTTGASKLLFNSIRWELPNTSFSYISGSTTGLVSTNPTQTAVTNNKGAATTALTWAVAGSLAPGESVTLYFNAKAQNTAATNLLSDIHIVAQTPSITFDTGDVAAVNLSALYVTPATPINLVATNTTQTSTTLSWSASANAVSYSVYDTGVLVQSGITGTSFPITGLAVNSTHNYTVKAISTYNVESNPSNSLQVVTPALFIVTYDTQGGSNVTGTTKLYNEKVIAPITPTREGYTFGGWYKEAGCTNLWNFASDIITSDTTIYANWTINSYTATFETNGGTTIASRIVPYNSLLDVPAIPTKENYTFGGWFHDAEFTHVYDYDNFDGDDTITEDKTIYVKWNLNFYTVSFNAQNGIPFKGIEVASGLTIKEPVEIPVKAGYTFAGWYEDTACTIPWDFKNRVVTRSFTMHAKWTINSYSVAFQTNDGTAITAINADYNSTISEPTQPTKTGYTFAGWYQEADFTNVWDFANDVVTTNTTIYAKWTINSYNVTFNSEGGSEVAGKTADYNTIITAPTQPTKTGYSFGGWYKEPNCTNVWNFASDVVTTNIILYAKWSISTYTVTFETNGGTTIASRIVPYNSLLEVPAIPTKENYTFGGWFHDAAFTHVYDYDNFDEDDTITEDKTIYVKWSLNFHTVSFNAQNGIPFPGVEVASGQPIKEPVEIPVKPGYTFAGWYVDSEGTIPWDFADRVVTQSFTMHAKWSNLPQYTVTLNAGSNGTVVADPIDATVFQGQTVTYTITPDTGYEINTITYNNAPVFATKGTYTTPSIVSNATLNVTFSLKALVPPTIATGFSEKRDNVTLNVIAKNGDLIENKLFDKTHIAYATISNPDNFTLVSQGMILKDVLTGKWVDLPIVNKTHSGQFAVHLFGEGVGADMGFIDGQAYTLQSYLKYLDIDGVVRRVTIGEEKSFIWE